MEELSDTGIRTAKPAERQYTMADGQGLGVLVRTNGTKLWLYCHRVTPRPARAMMCKHNEI